MDLLSNNAVTIVVRTSTFNSYKWPNNEPAQASGYT